MTETREQEPATVPERLITIREAAGILGISTRALYRLAGSGEIPKPVKIGRATRMSLTEVHAYIERLKALRR